MGIAGRELDIDGHLHARTVSASGRSSPHRINPFDLPPSDPSGEGSALLDHIQQVLGLLDVLLAEPAQRLSLTERAILDRAIKETYELAGQPSSGTHRSLPASVCIDEVGVLCPTGCVVPIGIAITTPADCLVAARHFPPWL
jgi:hypothetical protein